MIQISMYDANDFVESVILDGEAYKLHFSWNDNAASWVMDFRTEKNEDIVRGIAVVPNYPLLNQVRRMGLIQGELVAVVVNSDAENNQTIGRDDFINEKFSLVFVPLSELEEILTASVSS